MIRQRTIQQLFSQSQILMDKLTKSDHFNIKKKRAFNDSATLGASKRISLKQAIQYFSSKPQQKDIRWFNQTNKRQEIRRSAKKRRQTQIVQNVPQLSIYREPIRCRTQCRKSTPDRKNMQYSLIIIKKKPRSSMLFTPVSTSIGLKNNQEENNTMRLMTEFVGQVVNIGVTKSKLYQRKTKKNGFAQKKQQLKKKYLKKQPTPKVTSRSEEKIIGWDVRNLHRQETVEFVTK